MKSILKFLATLGVLTLVLALIISPPFTTGALGGPKKSKHSLFNGASHRANAHGRPAEAAWDEFVIDVACDATTMNMNGVGEDGAPLRGTTFIVDGKIYPANSIPDGDGFDIATEGDTGTWTCRGTFIYDWSVIVGEGKQEHTNTIQQFFFGESGDIVAPDSLRIEGVEGEMTSLVVFGGTGEYRGVIGEVAMDSIGSNNTGNPNFRFTFKVRRGA